jgi:hypothetical protein
LSGLTTGLVVLLALHQLRTPGAPRWPWAGVLGLVAFKTVGDLSHTGAWFVRYDAPGVRSSSVAHAAGALVAVLHYGAERLNGGRWRPPENETAGARDGRPAARFR